MMATPEEYERTVAWARRKLPKRRDRSYVESQVRQKNSGSLIKHLVAHHVATDSPCLCGFSEQELVDMMDWSEPRSNSFRYASPYRHYPRIIKITPHLDHSAYARMITGFKSLTEVFGFFANTGAKMDFKEFESILDRRYGGSYMESEEMRSWIVEQAQSAKTGQMNRWSKCEFLRPVVAAVEVAEVMLG